ncbi:MAG: hypothetical protein FWG65_11120 [Turicibacter sp.]|nr:hypothetical protein [Turicibacter sp.]
MSILAVAYDWWNSTEYEEIEEICCGGRYVFIQDNTVIGCEDCMVSVETAEFFPQFWDMEITQGAFTKFLAEVECPCCGAADIEEFYIKKSDRVPYKLEDGKIRDQKDVLGCDSCVRWADSRDVE